MRLSNVHRIRESVRCTSPSHKTTKSEVLRSNKSTLERKLVTSVRGNRARRSARGHIRKRKNRRTSRARKVAEIFTLERSSVPSTAGGIINIHNPELETSVERAARRPHAAHGQRPNDDEKNEEGPDANTRAERSDRAERAPTSDGGRENALTAKDPNRRVNTLLTLRREARKPNGIRFGDLVGGLRRPPAATTTSALRLLYTDMLQPLPSKKPPRRSIAVQPATVDACVSIPLEDSSALRRFYLGSIGRGNKISYANARGRQRKKDYK